MPDPYWTAVGKQIELVRAVATQKQVNLGTIRRTFRCRCGREATTKRYGTPLCGTCKTKIEKASKVCHTVTHRRVQ